MKTIKETHGTVGGRKTAATTTTMAGDLILALDAAVKLLRAVDRNPQDEIEFRSLVDDIEKKYHITFGK